MTAVELTWSCHHGRYPRSVWWTQPFPSMNPGELHVLLLRHGGLEHRDWQTPVGWFFTCVWQALDLNASSCVRFPNAAAYYSPQDFLLINYCFVVVFFLQFDNLSAAHETSKLEIEASHSEKIDLLKKAYEASLSGKDAFSIEIE